MKDIYLPAQGSPVLLNGLRGNPMKLQLLAQRLLVASHIVCVPYLRGYGFCQAKPGEIGYIDARSTGTKVGDHSEAEAIGRLFGQVGEGPGVSSAKGIFGGSNVCLAVRFCPSEE